MSDIRPDFELGDIKDFLEKFDLKEPVTQDWLFSRWAFIREESDELRDAVLKKDPEAIFDALLDIVYVAKGTAAIMGLPWEKGWAEVHRSNMDKVPMGASGRLNKDLRKPTGWVGPQLDKVLGQYELDL